MLSEFFKSTETKIVDGDIDYALNSIRGYVDKILDNKLSAGRVFVSSMLDELCISIAKHLKEFCLEKLDFEVGKSLFVISYLPEAGGHVELINDLLNLPALNCSAGLYNTDLFGINTPDHVLPERINLIRDYYVSDECSLEKKIYEFVKFVRSKRYENIVLLCHNQDVAVIVGSLLLDQCKVYYIHHADTHLALGATIKTFKHVDLHKYGQSLCGVNHQNKNIYLPLTTFKTREKCISSENLSSKNSLTCGRYEKFHDDDYEFQYIDFILKILETPGLVHHHVGRLPEELLVEIKNRINERSFDIKRFIYVPYVASLPDYLLENRISFYFSSFPICGAKAIVEAMSVGLPIVLHANYNSYIFSGVDIAYKNAFIWKNYDELSELIQSLDHDVLLRQSILSSTYFNRNHKWVIDDIDKIFRGNEVDKYTFNQVEVYSHENIYALEYIDHVQKRLIAELECENEKYKNEWSKLLEAHDRHLNLIDLLQKKLENEASN